MHDLDPHKRVWKILTIDAVASVNEMTKKALGQMDFLGKTVFVLKVSSIQQAQEVLKENADIAVVLLDTMAETKNESLAFIHFIRTGLKNYRTRIILRTGYPDALPEIHLIESYEIDGYIPKETMSAAQIKIAIMTAIRAYHQIITTAQVLQALAGSIAHEMRTPLGQAQFSLDQIERAMPSPAVYGQAPAVEIKNWDTLYMHIAQGQTAIKRGEQIIRMILNEVSGKPLDPGQFEYLEAGASTQKIVESYSFDTPDERDKVRVQITADFTFKVDETAYTFVLYNLLKNALYYFGLKREASMTITVAAPKVVVRDTGPGMGRHVLAKLFDAFATSGKAEGTGLGLAYCKRAMQAFGGDITCESVEGVFTEFTLHFPVVTAAEVRAHERGVLQKGLEVAMASDVFAGKTIVVADDDRMNRKMVMSCLRPWGMTLLEAQNGLEVMALLETGVKVDAVLMDMEMPGMGGLEATRWMRGHPQYQDTAVIALTSNFSDADIQKTREAGMNGFLSKPVSVEGLREKLAAVWMGKGAWPDS